MEFGFGFGFQMFNVMFFVMFLLVFGVFVVTALRGLRQWNRNNNSPRLTVEATVVSRRTQVGRHHHNNPDGPDYTSTYTTYFATFQVESGDRMELKLDGSEYGMLVEGDRGKLTFQGTRYLGFVRQ